MLSLVLACQIVIADTRTLLVVGDSLSDAYGMPREAGWTHLLDQRLGEAYTVVNASISGDTTAGAVSRIDDLLERNEPHALLIILGGNDGLRALSPAQVESNLEELIERGKDAGARVMLMQIRMPPNLGPVYVQRFEAVYPRLAERHDVTLLPFFLDGIFDQSGMMMTDGIHPTPEAQPRMLDKLWPHVQALLSENCLTDPGP